MSSVQAMLTCPACGLQGRVDHKYCAGCGFPLEKLQEPEDDPLIGCTLPGGHVVLELIEIGGMGRVYRAEQKLLGRTVAVKIIHPHLLGDETVEARFITEARAASQLNHPNSVGVIDFGNFDGRLYMVMEYLRGRDLATVLHDDGLIEIERVVDIMIQILAALAEAHHNGIVHRDLKPENVVLSPLRSGGDFVKVLDFGLAKLLDPPRANVSQVRAQENRRMRITDPGMVCGTPEYMAPEQARGGNIDHRADIYACGVLLFELLTGNLPFDGETPREVVIQHLSQIPIDPRDAAPDRAIPKRLAEVTLRALAKDAAARPQTAALMAQELRDATAGSATGPVEAPPQALAQCPRCGTMMPGSQKYCGDCGAAMHEPEVGEAGRPSQLPPVAQLPLPLIGRDDEFGRLFEMRDAASSSLLAIRLAGHAGVGKSRLVRDFLHNVGSWGDVVANARPDPWWAFQSFATLRSLIEQLGQLPEDASTQLWPNASAEERAGLDIIFGRENESVSQAPHRRWTETSPSGPDKSSRRALVAEGLRWAFAQAQSRCGEDARVIVAIDDLSAVDGPSRHALQDIVREPPLQPALLIASHRPEFEADWEGSEQLDMRGIDVELVATAIPGPHLQTLADLPPESSQQVAPGEPRRVLPLYLDQLIRFCHEGGDQPPFSLADLVALRIERLPADARRVLQAVAVLGDATDSSQLVALLPDLQELSHYVNSLREEGFLLAQEGVLSCHHPLIRDVTITSTPAAVRRLLHSRARRDFGPETIAAPLEADAFHAYHAAQSFEALMLLERVASKSQHNDDIEGAVRALRMALDLARREMGRGDLDDPASAVLMFSCKLGDILATSGKAPEAEGVLREAMDLAAPSSPERARLLGSLAQVSHILGDQGNAYQFLEDALSVAEKAHAERLVDALETMRHRWVAGA